MRLQALCVFVLRCYRVAVAPLVAYCVLLWGVGLGGGYLLAYRGIGPWAAHAVAARLLAARRACALALHGRLFCRDSAGGLFGRTALRRERLPQPAGRKHGCAKRRTRARRALDPQLGAVALRHVLDDRQAQAGAAGLARAAAVDAVEAFGQPRQVLGRDARAAVAHRELAPAVGQQRASCTSTVAAAGRVANGIAHAGWTSR